MSGASADHKLEMECLRMSCPPWRPCRAPVPGRRFFQGRRPLFRCRPWGIWLSARRRMTGKCRHVQECRI
jgi:hypothetical protein